MRNYYAKHFSLSGGGKNGRHQSRSRKINVVDLRAANFSIIRAFARAGPRFNSRFAPGADQRAKWFTEVEKGWSSADVPNQYPCQLMLKSTQRTILVNNSIAVSEVLILVFGRGPLNSIPLFALIEWSSESKVNELFLIVYKLGHLRYTL